MAKGTGDQVPQVDLGRVSFLKCLAAEDDGEAHPRHAQSVPEPVTGLPRLDAPARCWRRGGTRSGRDERRRANGRSQPRGGGTIVAPVKANRLPPTAVSLSPSGFAGLEDVDRLGELPGAPGTAAEFAQDAPGFELGRWRARPGRAAGHEPGWPLRPGGFVLSPVRRSDVALTEVALVAQHDQAGGGQLAHDAPDPGGGQVMHRAGQRPGHPHDVPVRAGDDLHVHPVLAVLPPLAGNTSMPSLSRNATNLS